MDPRSRSGVGYPAVASKDGVNPGSPGVMGQQQPLDPSTDASDPNTDGAETAEDKPWGTLTVVMFALFISLGLNLYMAWITAGLYRRYLDVADDLSESDYRRRDRSESRDRDAWDDRSAA